MFTCFISLSNIADNHEVFEDYDDFDILTKEMLIHISFARVTTIKTSLQVFLRLKFFISEMIYMTKQDLPI